MKVVISGFYGAGNLGDEAILSAIIQLMRKKNPDVELTALSLNPAETKKLHRCNAIFYPYFGPKFLKTEFRKLLKNIKESDLVMIGGGGLLQDAHNYFAIPYHSFICILAKFFKKPVMFYSIGVGPINNRISKILVRTICNLSDLIVVRDKVSKEFLLSLGVSKKVPVFVSPDPVFVLQSVSSERAKEIMRKEGVPVDRRPLIGISIRKTEWLEIGEMNKIARLIDYVASYYGATIVFIPFGYDGIPTDLWVSKWVISWMENKQKVYLIEERRYSPQEIMGIIGQLDFLIGMRLHSLIMSAVKGVPMLAISYLPKVKDILKDFGYKDSYVIEGYPLLPTFDHMKKSFDKAWQDKQGIIIQLKKIKNLKTMQIKALELSNLMNKLYHSNISLLRLALISCFFIIAVIILGFFQIYRSRISRFL